MSSSSSIDTLDSAAAKAQQAAAAAKKGGKDAQSDSVKSFLSGGAGGISAVLVGEFEHERSERRATRMERRRATARVRLEPPAVMVRERGQGR